MEKEVIQIKGLPRPTTVFESREGKYGVVSGVRPIPWQSTPGINDEPFFLVIPENESRVYVEHLCAYCGLDFDSNETVVRWVRSSAPPLIDLVRSDFHPFHEKCMKQARHYCPFMATLNDECFEQGTYWELFSNALNDAEGIRERE